MGWTDTPGTQVVRPPFDIKAKTRPGNFTHTLFPLCVLPLRPKGSAYMFIGLINFSVDHVREPDTRKKYCAHV